MAKPKEAPTDFPLEDGELVDDRALERAEDDRFRHSDFIIELGQLVMKTAMPANIALFAPWGSGKSSVANVLPAQLPKKDEEVRFVKFNAFKYAEAPLRRQFLSQVAENLKLDGKKYGDELYIATEGRDITFPARELLKLTWAFLIAVGIASFALLLVVTLVAALSDGPFGDAWSNAVNNYLLAAVPLAAVIGTFVKLASDGFHIKTTRSAPSSDEEFEKKFCELVDDAKTKRLVIFVDELDRCSPGQVASTLETIKTFLEVDGCVFIVAADQQVLEQALRARARQSTPRDTTNPYYSAGSSYLDKVFQYQLSLPPLKPSTLATFAYNLVKDSPGVWQRIPALDQAVSVLIPTHVTSPRRVKVLLNRFASTYRLAERRAAAGLLSKTFSDRSAELAKLVCLQSEFPLFADALTVDARMPQVVLAVADGEPVPPGTPDEVEKRATAFVEGRTSVTELLVGSSARKSEGGTPSAASVGDEEEKPAEEEESDDSVESERDDAVVRAQAHQLVRYLRKTAHFPGPGGDLLYLKSAGGDTDLDPAVGDRLARAAIDNEIDGVLKEVAALEEPDRKRDALRVLADVVREEHVGIEGSNVVTALLQSIELSGVELDGVADGIADAIGGHLNRYTLEPKDLRGAVMVSRASSRAVGDRLKKAVLDHPETYKRAGVCVEFLSVGASVLPDRADGVGRATVIALLDEPEAAAEQLKTLEEDAATAVLENASEQLVHLTTPHYTKVDDESSEATLRDPPPEDALGRALDVLMDGPTAVKEALAALMLDLDRTEARNALGRRLDGFGSVSGTELTRKVLVATRRRHVNAWGGWLGVLKPEVVSSVEDAGDLMARLATGLWDLMLGEKPPSEENADTALRALRSLIDGGVAVVAQPMEQAFRERVEPAVTTNAEAEARATVLGVAQRFVEGGLLDAGAVADRTLASCVATLETPPPATSRDEVSRSVLQWVEDEAARGSKEALESVMNVARESSWLDENERVRLQMSAAAGVRERDESYSSPLSTAALREFAANGDFDEDGAHALATWLRVFQPAPRDVWMALEPLAGRPLPAPLDTALREYASRLDSGGRFELTEGALDRTLTDPVDASFLAAALFSEVDSKRIVPRLVELWGRAGHDLAQRRTVLDLWRVYAPSGTKGRQTLVESIYLPLVASGDEGFDLALEFFGLVADPPSGMKKRIREALRKAGRTGEQSSRLDEKFLDAGWAERGLKTLGRMKDKGD